MKLTSVNNAILENRASQRLLLEGLLCYSFEDVSINHWPQSESKDGYESSISLITKTGSIFELNSSILTKWSGKRVVVTGLLLKRKEGCGHMGLWSWEIEATNIELYKNWKRDRA